MSEEKGGSKEKRSRGCFNNVTGAASYMSLVVWGGMSVEGRWLLDHVAGEREVDVGEWGLVIRSLTRRISIYILEGAKFGVTEQEFVVQNTVHEANRVIVPI